MWWCVAFAIYAAWNLGEYYVDHKYGCNCKDRDHG